MDGTLTQQQILLQTSFTKTGRLNMRNRKPYRTKEQRALAKKFARKTENGNWHSSVPVSFHQ